MISVGDILRREREAQGRTAASVAAELCLTKDYLGAVESDDVQSLPGTFFYKSFVKQYASLLGLDPSKLSEAMDVIVAEQVSGDLEDSEAIRAASDVPHHSSSQWRGVIRMPDPLLEAANKLDLSGRNLGFPAILGFLVVLLACSGFYAWWVDHNEVNNGSNQTEAPLSKAVPAAPEPPGVEVTTTTDADGTQRVILNLSATEETWLSITSEGKQVFSGILQPSETKTVSGVEGARMKVGNAGGIEVRLNGRELGPIGESGQVREVEFSSDDFEIVRPNPRQAPESGETL